jgi:hypothetical protein
MARYNEILIGRINRFLTKHYGMKGPAPAPQLQADVSTALNLRSGVENNWLQAWDTYGSRQFVAGVAAQFSVLRCANPLSSNMLAVLHRLTVWESAADTVLVRMASNVTTSALAGAGVASQPFDSRTSGRQPISLTFSNVSTGAAPAIGQPIGDWPIGANSPFEVIPPVSECMIPVLPGTMIDIIAQTANTNLHANYWFSERFLEESERQ